MRTGRRTRQWIRGLIGIVLVSCGAATSGAQEAARPRIALVLGGGGARGAAHIGVLKVLEAERIPVDFVVGSSMGAAIGAFYAEGMSPEEIEAQFHALDWTEVFRDTPPRAGLAFRRKQDDLQDLASLDVGLEGWRPILPRGLLAGQSLGLLLRRLTLPAIGIDDFDHLCIPFRAVATDIETGEAVVLGRGDLATAVRASMAVPGIFAPVPSQGRWLVDGGLAANLPIDVGRELGADVVIAVDVGTPMLDRDQLQSLVDISLQVTYILLQRNSTEQIASLGPKDALLHPVLDGISATDFGEYAQAILAGQEAARQAMPSLRRYAVSPERFRKFRARRHYADRPTVRIDSLEIRNRSSVTVPEILARLTIVPGPEVPVHQLQRDISRVYGIGNFEQVDYEILPGDGGNRLVITTTGRTLGTTHVRAGITLRSNFRGDSGVSTFLDVTHTQLNRRGAEWKNRIGIGETERLFSEFYQPVDYGGLFFVAPRIEVERNTRGVFSGRSRISEYSVGTAGIGMDVGFQIGPQWGEVRLGLVEEWARADPRTGSPDLPGDDLRRGAYTGSLVLDQLDRATFPRRGEFGYVRLRLDRTELGADVPGDRMSAGWTQVATHGVHTWTGSLEFDSSLESTLPEFDRFDLGGFLRLSGYRRGQLGGNHTGLARLAYRREFGSLPRGLGKSMYLGASAEAGNAWPDHRDIGWPGLIRAGSVFFAVDTVLGPVHLAYGQAEGGVRSFHFLVGQTL